MISLFLRTESTQGFDMVKAQERNSRVNHLALTQVDHHVLVNQVLLSIYFSVLKWRGVCLDSMASSQL